MHEALSTSSSVQSVAKKLHDSTNYDCWTYYSLLYNMSLYIGMYYTGYCSTAGYIIKADISANGTSCMAV